MRCDEALELLCAALDGEIDPTQQAQLDEHLAQCPACRALRTELFGMEEALSALDVPAPAGLKEQIMDHLPPQAGKTKAVYWRRWCAMAAAAALVFLGVWQLPRFILHTGKNVSSADTAGPVPCMDAAPQIPENSDIVSDPLNDEAILPTYVEDEGVSVNAAPTPQPDPKSPASYTSYDAAGTPETTAAPTEDAAPEVAAAAPEDLRTFDFSARSAKADDQVQTNGGSIEYGSAAQAAPVPAAGAGAENRASAPLGTVDPALESALDLPVPELAPETAAPIDGAESPQPQQFLMTSAKMALETSVATDALPDETADPFASYCGILTVDQYEPSGQDFSVEFWEDGLRKCILSAGDFHALVERLDSQGLAYALTSEGEGVSPEAPCGLVIVTGQAEPAPVEAP